MTPARDEISGRGLPAWIRLRGTAVTLEILARPGAARSAVVRAEPRGLTIAIGAPADKGKANDELIRFIATLAGVTRASVEILRGQTSRHKTLTIATAEPAATAARILAAAPHR